MLYDKKANTSLTISDRVLYTGLGHSFANNDLVYVLENSFTVGFTRLSVK